MSELHNNRMLLARSAPCQVVGVLALIRVSGRNATFIAQAKNGHTQGQKGPVGRRGTASLHDLLREVLEIHHIIRQAKDGGDDPDNLIVLCPNCHQRRYHLSGEAPKVESQKMMSRRLGIVLCPHPGVHRGR